MKWHAAEINDLAKIDQELRKKLESEDSKTLWDKINKVDRENTKRLKSIVADIGLPTISKVGKKASCNAWLLVQHSPDLKFQKAYLKMMLKHKNDIALKNIAFLTDRILMYEGKRQIYGTQVSFDKKTNRWELYQVTDKKKLNRLRKEMGLGTIEKYLRGFC
ncbi:hypothetical protein IPM62_04050 [Candidatus Woesebacteria bacterium]|nr:MAG: hypothetical protein IPM62_04010 [Candidatus Woesebacteria bacterium]QQS38529.1 MAG: hypothetical protein IPM62_04050 [Candidatus Woesebacteria bacterium]